MTDWELASRLSYFLWSSPPDDELRELAAAGKLREPDVARRADAADAARCDACGGWRRSSPASGCTSTTSTQLDEKSERHFPTFAGLRGAMYEESIRFFTDLFQHDGSVLDILDADYTFLNEALAKHYGIPGVTGDRVAARRRREEVRARRHPRPGDDAGEAVRRVAHQPDPARQLGQRSAARREAAAAAEGRAAAARRRSGDRGADRPAARREARQRSRSAPSATRGSTRSASRWKASTRSAAAATRTWATGRSTRGRSSMDGTRVRRPRRPAELPADRAARRVRPAVLPQAAGLCAGPRGAALRRAAAGRDASRACRPNDYRVAAAVETIVRSRQFREIRGRDVADAE